MPVMCTEEEGWVIPGTWCQPVQWNQQAPAQWKTLTLPNADPWPTAPHIHTHACVEHTHTFTHIYIHSHTYMCGTHIKKTNKPHPWKQTNVKSWRGKRASRLLSDACYVSKIGRLKLLNSPLHFFPEDKNLHVVRHHFPGLEVKARTFW